MSAAKYKLTSRLAQHEVPYIQNIEVHDADSLLLALVSGSTSRGQYYANPALLRRLFIHQERIPSEVIIEWLSELERRADIDISPIAKDPYGGTEIHVITILRQNRFHRFAERAPIPADVRRMVYRRDGNKCLHCGTEENLSLDHIYPWSLGGSDEASNLQTLCRSCNSSKGAKVIGGAS